MPNDSRRLFEGIIFFLLFCLTIPLANWMLGHIGTICPPNNPCLIPVLPGLLGLPSLMAPSGVVMIGFALVLRDLVQRRLGLEFGLAAIVVGTALSALVAPQSLVIASAVAFFVSELADFAIYTPLSRRRLVLAVVASSLLGIAIDSTVFLWLAFGSLDFLIGQMVGKAWMVMLSIPFIAYLRRRDERLGLTPA